MMSSADAALFLTATPINLHEQDLFNLVNLLAPEDFDNFATFGDHLEPNQHINQAVRLVAAGQIGEASRELHKVESTRLRHQFLGSPLYERVAEGLEEVNGELPIEDRVRLQRELIELNTLAPVLTRTRKREIADAAVRAAVSVVVDLSPQERAFYDGVLRHARDEVKRAGLFAGFATVMKERQAASCLVALREAFGDYLRDAKPVGLEVDRSQFDPFDEDESDNAPPAPDLYALARAVGQKDSKFDIFEETLRGALSDDPTSKALIFSYFRGTLDYLRRQLSARGYRVDVIHGGVPMADRRGIIEDFHNNPQQRVLLSSEVGAEGLDFQFCDILINYDLPWNPMQVEQRIGRLDRFGQTHPRIRIYNFFLADTVETRILQRLYERIGIFERSIGDLEDILGKEIRELTRDVLQADLTPEQQVRRADQVAAAIVQKRQAEEELEQHKDELLGQGQILDQQIDEAIDSGRVISAHEVEALVTTFIETVDPRSKLVRDHTEPCWTLDVAAELAERLKRIISQKRLGARVSEQLQIAINRASSHGGRIPFTFDSDYARRRSNLEFVTVQHPLAEAARDYWARQESRGTPGSGAVVTGAADEVGEGYFFIYVLDVRAVVRRVTLEPLVFSQAGRLAPTASRHLLRALQDGPDAGLERPSTEGLRAAEEVAAGLISARRRELEEDVERRNEAVLAARAASIQNSFEAKIRRTHELLAEARETNIVRMRRAQIENLEARRQDKLEELESLRHVAVSYELIAAGRARVVLDSQTA